MNDDFQAERGASSFKLVFAKLGKKSLFKSSYFWNNRLRFSLWRENDRNIFAIIEILN
jgi:hypothetical protein